MAESLFSRKAKRGEDKGDGKNGKALREKSKVNRKGRIRSNGGLIQARAHPVLSSTPYRHTFGLSRSAAYVDERRMNERGLKEGARGKGEVLGGWGRALELKGKYD